MNMANGQTILSCSIRSSSGLADGHLACTQSYWRLGKNDGVAESWSGRRESNPRHTAWEAVVLPLNYARAGSSIAKARRQQQGAKARPRPISHGRTACAARPWRVAGFCGIDAPISEPMAASQQASQAEWLSPSNHRRGDFVPAEPSSSFIRRRWRARRGLPGQRDTSPGPRPPDRAMPRCVRWQCRRSPAAAAWRRPKWASRRA